MDGMVSREPHAGFGKEVEFLKLGETLFGREDVHYEPTCNKHLVTDVVSLLFQTRVGVSRISSCGEIGFK